MRHLFNYTAVALASSLLLAGCNPPSTKSTANDSPAIAAQKESVGLDIQYQQFELENGLKVIMHQDKSDPIVAMATIVHVGSNREKPGRTGFAHFFEHMSFNDSENVPKGANRKMIPELGGTRNGGTWSDGTIYYEVVPKDAFDKLLWIDSDRLGYMINTVNEPTLEREKQVVKNEKRQRVDNRPYGHTSHVIKKALYPKEHPYNWTVIGDLEDLQNATLDDVRAFYRQFYVPANATLVIAGDIDFAETKQKVNNWFGEIKAGEKMAPLQPWPIALDKTIKLYHQDNFAKLPEIRLTFPTVEQYHPDAYALDALAAILSDGKKSALYRTIVEEKKLAPSVNAWNSSEELAGTFTLLVRANPNTPLDHVQSAINDALALFESEGIDEKELTRIKAERETAFYYNIESILDKALELGIYNEYAGSPDFIKQDIANILAVSPADIKRVYQQYIKGKASIVTSFVPMDQLDLIVTGSTKADVVEELVEQGAEKQFEEKDEIAFEKTPTKFDRSEPPLTELPVLKTPDVWQSTLENGLSLYGIEQTELPVVNFNLRIDGGQFADAKDKVGTAYLMAQLLNEGTASKTPKELEQAIGLLGASLSFSAGQESIRISGRTLAKNFDKTIELMNEMLLSPRWDANEFARLKQARLTDIAQSKGNAPVIARNAFMKTLYGDNHAASIPLGGLENTVANISLDDVKQYYKQILSPKNAHFHVVGHITPAKVNAALSALNLWSGEKYSPPVQQQIAKQSKPTLYFIDLPGAKQSVIYVGKPSVSAADESFYPIQVANNRLGDGMSARLAQTLRIQKGYTYGAYSYLSQTSYQSPFIASSQVRTNVTLESLEIFKTLIGNYQQTYTDDDLAVSKNMIIKGSTRQFETLNSLLAMLDEMSQFGLAADYVKTQQNYVKNVALADVHQVINNHLNEQEMIYLVVGDAETQLNRMEKLGYGKPVLLDIDGNKL